MINDREEEDDDDDDDDDIPLEFQPIVASQLHSIAAEEEKEASITNLFGHEDDNDNDIDAFQSINIGSSSPIPLSFTVRLPPDIGTLFAHRVWSGSKLLAEYLAKHATDEWLMLPQSSMIEFGAGTALPSLVALAYDCPCAVLTDYPHDDLLQAMRDTVGRNWDVCGRPKGRVAVMGHAWGTSTDQVVAAVPHHSKNTPFYFDIAILSECIWLHRSHSDLLTSIHRLLHPISGRAIVTYAHHVPGHEAADEAFFTLAQSGPYQLETIIHESHDCSYMWDDTKTIVVHLKVLARRQAAITKRWIGNVNN